MFAIINWGKDAKKIGNAAIMQCDHCSNVIVLEIYEMASSAGLFFVKLVKWNKKYVAACPICKYGCELDPAKIEPLLRDSITLPDHKVMVDIYSAVDSEVDREIKPLKEKIALSPELTPELTDKAGERLDKIEKELHIRVSSRGFNPNHLKRVSDYYFAELRRNCPPGLLRDAINVPNPTERAEINNALNAEFDAEVARDASKLKETHRKSPEMARAMVDQWEKDIFARVAARGFNPNHLRYLADNYFQEMRRVFGMRPPNA